MDSLIQTIPLTLAAISTPTMRACSVHSASTGPRLPNTRLILSRRVLHLRIEKGKSSRKSEASPPDFTSA